MSTGFQSIWWQLWRFLSGFITLSSTSATGTCSGTFEVTVDYQ
jgi:hypothetical protein